MSNRKPIVIWLGCVLALSAVVAQQVWQAADRMLSSFVSIAHDVAQSPWAEAQRTRTQRGAADYRLLDAATLLPPARPAPPERAAYQVCMLGSRSCMSLEQRPFRICRIGDPNCDQTVQVELLSYRVPGTDVP